MHVDPEGAVTERRQRLGRQRAVGRRWFTFEQSGRHPPILPPTGWHDGPVGHLIAAADLAAELESSPGGLVVIDVRWALTLGRVGDAPAGAVGRPDYDDGHLSGAHFVDLDSELAAAPGDGGRHPLPDPAVVESTLRRCGVSAGSRVVVYDGRDSMAAARAWWVFRWAGLAGVRVLDGGYAAWRAAGLPVTSASPTVAVGDFTVQPGSLPTLDPVEAAAWARDGLLLDARSPERYAGEAEPIDPVAGHIPGAVNSPTISWLADDGSFRSDLSEHWDRVRAGRDGSVAVYCGSGVTAAHHILALAEVGVDATLYPGSWSEWVRDPDRPIATGPEPG